MSVPVWFSKFVAEVLRVKLSRAQNVIAKVVVDGVEPKDLSANDRELARRCFGDIDVIPALARSILAGVFGARSGKSYVFAGLYCLWRALTADLSTLADGELAVALVVAPDTRLAKQVIRYALGAAKACASIAPLIESETADGFILRRPDGRAVSIEALPATRGGSAVRGRSLVCAVLDEACFFRSEEFAVNDLEIFKAVSPRVLPGGMIVIISTPWAETGLLYDEFTRNWGNPTTAIACRAPTDLMRDDAPAILAMVQRERLRDPDNALREFDGEFWAFGTSLFFQSDAVRACVDNDVAPQSSAPRDTIVGVGGDLALVRDSAALVVVHRGPDGFYDVAEVVERKPAKGAPLKLSNLVAEFSGVARQHGSCEVLVDHHILEPAREHLPRGMTLDACEGGQQGKVNSYTNARNLIHSGLVRIPPQYRRIAEQLREVVAKPTSGGGLQISSPRRGGSHGDLASAFILGLEAASRLTSGVGAGWLGGAIGREVPANFEPKHEQWEVLLDTKSGTFAVGRWNSIPWYAVYLPDLTAEGNGERPRLSRSTGEKLVRHDAPPPEERLDILRIEAITQCPGGNFWASEANFDALRRFAKSRGAFKVFVNEPFIPDRKRLLRATGLRPIFVPELIEFEEFVETVLSQWFAAKQVSVERPKAGGINAIRAFVAMVARSQFTSERVDAFGFQLARGTFTIDERGNFTVTK
jgi:hypothetical protein